MEEKVRMLFGQEKAAAERAREPKAVEDRHYRRKLAVEMTQDEMGMWWMVVNGGAPLLATDVEVVLWERYQRARNEARQGLARAKQAA